jgi:hypothetical protein
MRIVDLGKFKEVVSKFSKSENRQLLEYLAFSRILCELHMVNILNRCDKDGAITSKVETLKDYASILEGERVLINILGRKESAKVYGRMEGITSDVKTVDYILMNDSVQHYKTLCEELVSKAP